MRALVNTQGVKRELDHGFFMFILLRGGVQFGFAAAALALFIDSFFSEISSSYIRILVPCFFVGGLIWGAIMWSFYKTIIKDRADQTASK